MSKTRMPKKLKVKTGRRIRNVFTFCALVLLTISLPLVLRPLPFPRREKLWQGIDYERRVFSVPRRIIVHIAAIDLTAPGIKLLVTPGESGKEVAAQTTSNFVSQYKVQFAVNGSLFSPFYSNNIFDYAPHEGDVVDIHGQVISNGAQYSPPQDGWPVFCFFADKPAVSARYECPAGAQQAIAGVSGLIHNGEGIHFPPDATQSIPESRLALGTDRDGTHLWIIAADGRQRYYSEGITDTELESLFFELGATEAMELDGGGSTTMVTAGRLWPHVLNSPIHTHIPMRERPVGNHLGIFALPLNGKQ